jgi:hypothetical protein
VSEHVPSNRLLGVYGASQGRLGPRPEGRAGTCYEHGTTARIGGHLVCDEYRYVELLRDLLQLAHHTAELLLSLCQLSPARIIHTKQRRDRVYNLAHIKVANGSKHTLYVTARKGSRKSYQETILIFDHLSSDLDDQLLLMLMREGSGIN